VVECAAGHAPAAPHRPAKLGAARPTLAGRTWQITRNGQARPPLDIDRRKALEDMWT